MFPGGMAQRGELGCSHKYFDIEKSYALKHNPLFDSGNYFDYSFK